MHYRNLFTAVFSEMGRRRELWGGLERRHGSNWQHRVPWQCQSRHTEREERRDGLDEHLAVEH